MDNEPKHRNAPGREAGADASQRPYSDQQETYRNPREEWQETNEATGPKNSQSGDSAKEAKESSSDVERTESRDSWEEPREGNFSDTRTRWPRDDKYRSEPRSQNWPHSRTGGGVGQGDGQYGYGQQTAMSHGERSMGEDHTGIGPEKDGEYGYGQQSSAAHGSRKMGENHTGLGSEDNEHSNERIREDIHNRLSDDAECDARGIEIDAKDGRVTLRGTVPARHMKQRAEEIADGVGGVREVDNRLRVGKDDAAQ